MAVDEAKEAKPTILLVDDDLDALDEMQDVVELEGWQSIGAASVEEAMAVIEGNPEIKVVVTDVHFLFASGEPTNGFQLTSRAQAQFADRELSFVVMSGDPSGQASSEQVGAVEFLSKPLVPEDLVEAIRKAEAVFSVDASAPSEPAAA